MAMILVLGACGANSDDVQTEFPDPDAERRYRYGSLTGGEGWTLFGGGEDEQQAATSGIGVNSFLWRGTLDTVSFMPISSADPFGGVILTDWYTLPESPNERFKMNVYILDRELRSDGIRVTVFRQVRDNTGGWVDAPVAPGTADRLEEEILRRARELRVASVAQ